jgi:hypothetical protein
MRYFIAITVLALQLTSCKNQKEVVAGSAFHPSKHNNKDTSLVLSLARTGCFGTCPADRLWVYADGSAKYYGIAHIKNKGTYKVSNLNLTQLDSVYSYANEIKFYELDSLYEPEYQISDLPKYTIYLKQGDKQHKLIDKSQAPREVRKLYTLIDNFINREDWGEEIKTK